MESYVLFYFSPRSAGKVGPSSDLALLETCLLFVGQLKMNKGCLASEKILYPNRSPDWVEDTQQMRSDIPVLDPSVFALDQRSHSIVSKAQ